MPLSGHDDVAFLNDVANDADSTNKIENYVKVASLKSETMGKLINRIPGLRFCYQVFQASLMMSTSVLKASPSKLDIKRY